MEISSVSPLVSTWKLNNPKAILKPPVLAETIPVKLETGSIVAVAGESMASAEVELTMLGDAVSTMVDPVMSTMVVGVVASMTVGIAMPTMVGDAVSMSMPMSMADEAMSMWMAGVAMSMSIGGAESTAVADDEPSTLVGVERSAMVGEGAGKSVDPDPVVPTVGAN
jgi:hypothetical protein